MSTVYVIADLHLGHRKLAEVRGFSSTTEHDDAIVKAWNSVVSTRDVVYVLGDVFRLERLPELRGVKKLAMGNHDLYPADRYKPHFSRLAAYYEYDNCLLSHIPVHPSQFPRYEMNVHGHTHAKRIMKYVELSEDVGHWMPDEHYLPVSVEQCPGMAPQPLQQLINLRRQRVV